MTPANERRPPLPRSPAADQSPTGAEPTTPRTRTPSASPPRMGRFSIRAIEKVLREDTEAAAEAVICAAEHFQDAAEDAGEPITFKEAVHFATILFGGSLNADKYRWRP